MQFKDKTKDEFWSTKTSRWLRFVLSVVAVYAEFILGKTLVVTDILRDPQAQLSSCRQKGYKSRFRHCIGVAADIRSRNMTEEQKGKLLSFVKRVLRAYCIMEFHYKKTPPHFHLELNEKYYDKAALWALVKNSNAEEWFAG